MAQRSEDDFSLQEKVKYKDLSALSEVPPPAAVQGPSGWVYQSSSLGPLLLLRPR